MGRTKALLEYHGDTFLGNLVRLFQPLCETVIVVLPPRGLACPAGVLCAVNPAPERGMLTSLQCGLRAVPDAVQFVFFTPVDLPVIQASTVAALAESTRAKIAVPRYHGRRGHPVLITREVIPEFLALPQSAQARDVVERHAAEIEYIDTDDPAILMDVDEPADYARLTGGA